MDVSYEDWYSRHCIRSCLTFICSISYRTLYQMIAMETSEARATLEGYLNYIYLSNSWRQLINCLCYVCEIVSGDVL
jgi:hypothetical protein